MSMATAIRGAGGGGKGGGGPTHAPSEAADTLRSTQYARVVDLISEGEIDGLHFDTGTLQAVFLDDTPVQNPDGTYNVSGFSIIEKLGTQGQSYIPGFSESEAEHAVGTQVTTSFPVTHSVTNPDVDAVRVTVAVPRLTFQNPTTGDLVGAEVVYAIDLQTNGGGFVEKGVWTISGKTTGRYKESRRVALTGSGPWDIKVRRVTADSAQSNLANDIFWESYTEIIDVKLRRPNSALVAIEADAQNFPSRIPKRGYLVRGVRIKVPTNYDPIARTYTGVWDGTFKIAWSNNPAWIFYDLLTNTRYGLGRELASHPPDKWELYEIAKYCDESVPDGFGGTEPRFTCNVWIAKRDQAHKLLHALASAFRAMPWWAAAGVRVSQDSPAASIQDFTAANVKDGEFKYADSALQAIHTVALVTWNDPQDRYRQRVEYVPDEEGIALYGVNETEKLAFGCTSRGQAHRLGRWLLYTERLEAETVTFRTGFQTAVYPGAIIRTQDQNRAGARFGGRLASATVTELTLDAAVTIVAAQTHTVTVQLPDGTLASRSVVEGVGTHQILTLATALSVAPQAHAIWILSEPSVTPEQWRVISVDETGDKGHELEVVAMAHNPSKYAAIEQGLALEPSQGSYLTQVPSLPTQLTVEETLYELAPGIYGTRATVSWEGGAAAKFHVTAKPPAGNLIERDVLESVIDIDPAPLGEWTFAVTPYNAIGRNGPTATLTQELLGELAPPADVTGFTGIVLGDQVHTQWDRNDEPDLDGFLIRYSPVLVSAKWGSAVPVGGQVGRGNTGVPLPLMRGTYLIKARDRGGRESTNAATLVVDAGTAGFNAVVTVDEAAGGFRGTHSGTTTSNNILRLRSADDLASWPALNSLPSIAAGVNGFVSSGTYDFDTSVDLGDVYTSRLTADFQIQGHNYLDTLDSWSRLDQVDRLDGADPSQHSATLQVRHTQDDPAGTPTWTPWETFTVGDYTARAFEFRIVLSSQESHITPEVLAAKITVDMPDRIASASAVVCPIGGLAVTFTPPFQATPAITITAAALATGDYHTLTAESDTGFSIEFFDDTDASVERTFNWIAQGWGRRGST